MAVAARTVRLRFLRTYLTAHAKSKPLAERHGIIPRINTYADHFSTLTRGDNHDD